MNRLLGLALSVALVACKSDASKCTEPGSVDFAACERACAAGSGASCEKFGLYQEGHYLSVPPPPSVDPDRARTLYERGCELGDGDACDAAGSFYSSGHGGVSVDLKRSKELSQKGCSLGSKLACDRIANWH